MISDTSSSSSGGITSVTKEATAATEYKKQISSLQDQLAEYRLRINYLEEINQEYQELRQAFGNNGNLTYYDAMNIVLTRKNRNLDQQHKMINAQRKAAYESKQIEDELKLEHEVLEENPTWQTDLDKLKEKIDQTRDKMYELAEQFYLLDSDKLCQYVSISHKVNESAVKHLINEIANIDQLGQEHFNYYQCDSCGEHKTSLADFERHCFNEGDTHHDVNISKIDEDAKAKITKATREFKQQIAQAVIAKKEQAQRKQMQVARAAETKAKQNLPYVK